MTPKQGRRKAQVIHLEKSIHAPVRNCFAAFGSTRTLNRWYDSKAELSGFKVDGEVKANYFPGYFIVAIVKDQLIAQSFTTIIDGLGLWIFIPNGENTRVVFDHAADGNQGDEMLARTFHWEGLLENLAAICEGQPVPFVNGRYPAGQLPKGIRHATCPEYVRAKRRLQPRVPARA